MVLSTVSLLDPRSPAPELSPRRFLQMSDFKSGSGRSENIEECSEMEEASTVSEMRPQPEEVNSTGLTRRRNPESDGEGWTANDDEEIAGGLAKSREKRRKVESAGVGKDGVMGEMTDVRMEEPEHSQPDHSALEH